MTPPLSRDPKIATSNWRSQASCLGVDPELFFPVGTLGPAVNQAKRAQRICRTCPVTMECLNWALRTGQQFGVWGGLSEDERRHMFHARRALTSVTVIAEVEPAATSLVA